MLSCKESVRKVSIIPITVRQDLVVGYRACHSGGLKGEADEARIRGTWGDGVPIAKNLIKAGRFAVWNHTVGRDGVLVEARARQVERPADVARGAQAVVLMLADAGAVRKVLFGEGGVVEGLPEGAAVIDMSIIGAADSVANAKDLGGLGYPMLDALVSGSMLGSEVGTWRSWPAERRRCWRSIAPSSRRWVTRSFTSVLRVRGPG